MPGSYTFAALAAAVVAVALELGVARTGILATRRFWLTVAITLAFQVPVDGWLTKLSAPIVGYDPAALAGPRWPWDIPVEDFGFAFAMVTVTLMVWERAAAREPAGADGARDDG